MVACLFEPMRNGVLNALVLLSIASLAALAPRSEAGHEPCSAQDPLLLAHWKAVQKSPVAYVVNTFKGGKRWVFLGEYHRLRQDVQLVLALIPALHEQTKVRCLALEFITARGTDEANRLVTQPTFDRNKALDFFLKENPSWYYEDYFKILETVWASNQERASTKGPFRLVGLAPDLDWEKANYGGNKAQQKERAKLKVCDEFMAKALERQVLSRHWPALVYGGLAHATAKFTEYSMNTGRPLPRMGNLVYRDPYKSEMWFIAMHAPFYDPCHQKPVFPFNGALDRLMTVHGQDLGFDVVGSPFATLRDAHPCPKSQLAQAFGELVDGYIIFKSPLREYACVTCTIDWVRNPKQYRWFCRHLPNKEASEELSRVPFVDFQKRLEAICRQDAESLRRTFQRLGDP